MQVFTCFTFSGAATDMVRNGLGLLYRGDMAVVITQLVILGAMAIALTVKLFR
ncbi:hypothetical protein [Paenarthrobacter sp. YJN-5]|uniref:hypothetical protein n=1 Tax=Paenarthrobacter sp. YJN-5 TaxID=2735316 RepID=UPI001878912E|nr:hypothetical protein [Paenarthrobacter sp. YJN-5]QOT19330.1 hypothetical protein HMI59_21985 [Paenarthrobacter sp. YJN-5]